MLFACGKRPILSVSLEPRLEDLACAQTDRVGGPRNQTHGACIPRAWLSCMQPTNQALKYIEPLHSTKIRTPKMSRCKHNKKTINMHSVFNVSTASSYREGCGREDDVIIFFIQGDPLYGSIPLEIEESSRVRLHVSSFSA